MLKVLCALLSGAAATAPHIVYVVVDDLGWNDMPWHNSDIAAPFIDSLHSDSVSLGDYHQYKVCSPSRASLMSGRYPNRAGLYNFIGHQKPEAVSSKYTFLAESLKKAGYATHIIGKWHLGYWDWQYIPTGRGFDSFFGYMGGAEDYYNHTHKGCDQQPTGPGYPALDLAITFPNRTIVAQPQFKDVYANDVWVPYTQKLLANHPKQTPLFLYWSIQHVHEPLQVPDSFKDAYANSTLPDDRITYMGMVSALDVALRGLVDSLKENGLWDNTLFIFSTDNGGNLQMGGNNYPLRGGKYSLFEGGNRGIGFVHSVNDELIPTAVRGTTFNGLFHVSDWYATLCEVAGAEVPVTAIDSISQWGALRSNGAGARAEIVHEVVWDAAAGNISDGKLRSGKWNFYWGRTQKEKQDALGGWWSPDSTVEPSPGDCGLGLACLFDMETDITEHHNLAAEYPEVVDELFAKLFSESTCPDGLCETEMYTGPNDACDAFDVYGAYGPWANIVAQSVPDVRFV